MDTKNRGNGIVVLPGPSLVEGVISLIASCDLYDEPTS